MKKIIAAAFTTILASGPTPADAAEFDVYLLAGQSNMDGRGDAAELAASQRGPFENVSIYYRRPPYSTPGWVQLIPGYSVPPKHQGGLPSQKFGPEIGFALAMTQAQPDTHFALIKGSQGGASLKTDWYPGTAGQPVTQGECYRNFVETIQLATQALTDAGHSLRVRGLLWHQGESDSQTTRDVYQQRFEQFIARLEEDINVKNFPVVVGEVFDNGERDDIRAALRTIGTSTPRYGFVSAADTTTWDAGTHFDATSQLLLGKRYAEAILLMHKSEQ